MPLQNKRPPTHPYLIVNPPDKPVSDNGQDDSQTPEAQTPAKDSVEMHPQKGAKTKKKRLKEGATVHFTSHTKKPKAGAKKFMRGLKSRGRATSKRRGGASRAINNLIRYGLDKYRNSRKQSQWKDKEDIKSSSSHEHDHKFESDVHKALRRKRLAHEVKTRWEAERAKDKPKAADKPQSKPITQADTRQAEYRKHEAGFKEWGNRFKSTKDDYHGVVRGGGKSEKISTFHKDDPRRASLLSHAKGQMKHHYQQMKKYRQNEETIKEYARTGGGRLFNNLLRSYLDAKRDKRQMDNWKERQDYKAQMKNKKKDVNEGVLKGHYHSVFYKTKDAGDTWRHHTDCDDLQDAKDERDGCKHSHNEKAVIIKVPKKDADWRKVNIHNFVETHLNKKNKKFTNEEITMDRKALLEKVGPLLAAHRARQGNAEKPAEKKKDAMTSRIDSWKKEKSDKESNDQKRKAGDSAAKSSMAKKMGEHGAAKERKKVADGMSEAGRNRKPDAKPVDSVAAKMSHKERKPSVVGRVAKAVGNWAAKRKVKAAASKVNKLRSASAKKPKSGGAAYRAESVEPVVNKPKVVAREEVKPAYVTTKVPAGTGSTTFVEKFNSLPEARTNYLSKIRKGAALTMNETMSLMRKAEESGIEHTVIKEIYKRGVQDWVDSEVADKSPSQHAFNRINSFISGGEASQLDEDLLHRIQDNK